MILSVVLVCLFQVTFGMEPHPWDSASRPDEWWQAAHRGFTKNTKNNGKNIKIIFFGDSLISGWIEDNDHSHGIKVWKENYEKLSAVSYGIGGDRTEHLVYRAQNGEFDGSNPKVVIVEIGANNMDSNSADDIAKGIRTIIDSIHKKLPNTKVLLLGILCADKPYNPKIKETNKIIAKFENGKSVRFLNMNSHFEDDKGAIHKDLYTDGEHLTMKGYKLWAQTMNPLLNQMLK